jgi:anti-sigma factor RsiW
VTQFRRTECTRARDSFSGYLDGTISGREMQSVAGHLERCTGCTAEFDEWRGMQRLLAEHASAAKAPADLGLKLRLAISHEKTRRQTLRDNLSMRWENLVRPALLQACSGVAGAMILVGGIAMLVGVVAVPNAVLANDEPLGAVTMPHYLYSAAEEQPVVTRDDSTIVVQAEVNAQGRVYDYQIVSGPTDARTQDEVRDQLMLQVYEPARMFGEPVRGQVLITFSGVVVHG